MYLAGGETRVRTEVWTHLKIAYACAYFCCVGKQLLVSQGRILWWLAG